MYFAKITQTYSAANKLHEKLQQFIKQHNRMTIEDGYVGRFQRIINTEIATLNAEHPRCKPVKPTWWNPSSNGDKDYSLSFSADVICLTLYKVERAWDTINENAETKQQPIMIDGIPRRNMLELNSLAEKEIHNAMGVVEDCGADTRLTGAVILLQGALDLVGDFEDEQFYSNKKEAKS